MLGEMLKERMNHGMDFDHNLSVREKEICGMIAKGFSSKQIASLLYLTDGTVKNYTTSIYEKTGTQNRVQLTTKYVAKYVDAMTDMPDITVDGNDEFSITPDAVLRFVGQTDLPDTIPIIFEGQSFIIGRFDVSVGRKQCDFEFDKATKAVSRRHASIENTRQGYEITDLHSRAGTYINGKRIPPGTPSLLQNGDRVAFGSAGADYVFECC